MMKNYYQILGVSYGVDLSTIKKAYRQLALQYHPDKNKAANAEQMFIAITEAYEVLRDKIKRAEYDFLYKKYFQSPDINVYEESTHERKQQSWTSFGEQRAKEYSSMKYEDFSQRILDEIKIGVSYTPNLIFIFICVLGLYGLISALPKVFSNRHSSDGTGILIVFFILGFGTLVYFLFQRMQADYTEERKRKFK